MQTGAWTHGQPSLGGQRLQSREAGLGRRNGRPQVGQWWWGLSLQGGGQQVQSSRQGWGRAWLGAVPVTLSLLGAADLGPRYQQGWDTCPR